MLLSICVGVFWALFLLGVFALAMWWDNYR